MTETNQKVIDTLTVLGVNGLDELKNDGLLYKEWYNLGNTIKYLNKLEHKFNIDLKSSLIDCIKYELCSEISLFWQTVYKLTESDTYENLGLHYSEDDRKKLCKVLRLFDTSNIGSIIKAIYETINRVKIDTISEFFLENRECIKHIYVHNDKIYVVKDDADYFWDTNFLVKKVKTKGTYNISEVEYKIWRGTMGGKALIPMMTHDSERLLVKGENYGYITRFNCQHNLTVRFDKYAYLLKDCYFILF